MRLDELTRMYDDECKEHQMDNDKNEMLINSLREEMSSIAKTVEDLELVNMGLKAEIDTYNKLLSAEEKKYV